MVEFKQSSKTILLVEDEAVLALSTSRLLKKQGYQVIIACCAEESLEKLRAHPEINLILMDIDLGEGIDGPEVAQHILREREVPVVFLSGHNEPEVVARTEKITSYGYVLKGSGENVLDASIKMAFKLYEASRLLNEREARLEMVLEEQRTTMEALQEKTLELDTFFENVLSLLCFADTNGNFIRVNREWERVLGYAQRELNGCRFLDLVHPDDIPATLAVMQQLSEQQPVINFVNRYRHRDGTYRWIEWFSKPYGQLLMGVASDITERVLAEQMLKKQQTLLNNMGDMARVGGWELDLASNTLTWTQEVYRIHELGFDFVPNLETGLQFYAPDSRTIISAAVQRAIESGEPFNLELQLITAAGSWLWVQVIGRAEMENGKVRAVSGTIQDISAHKQLLSALRASEERYRTLVEISPAPISQTDLQGNFITINPAGLRQLGYASLQAMQAAGLTSILVIAEPDRQRAIENAYKTLKYGSVSNIEYQVRARDGNLIATEISAALIRDSEGQPAGFLGISHDISERKQAEEAQARALDEKSILLRDLQHRIKNSLALIGSLIFLEQENAGSEATRKALGEVYDRVNSLSGLYTILYDSNNIQTVWLGQYLQQVSQSLANTYLYNRQGVTLAVHYEPVSIDARQATPFGLILNELLTNALKYAFPGEQRGTIWVDLHKSDGQLVLQVADDGIGLPAAPAGGRSSGLGLQIVELLVRQLRGSMTCQQTERTTFTVFVPYGEVAAKG